MDIPTRCALTGYWLSAFKTSNCSNTSNSSNFQRDLTRRSGRPVLPEMPVRPERQRVFHFRVSNSADCGVVMLSAHSGCGPLGRTVGQSTMDVGLPLVPKLCLGTQIPDAPRRFHHSSPAERWAVRSHAEHGYEGSTSAPLEIIDHKSLLTTHHQPLTTTVHASPYQIGWPISTEIFGQARIFYHGVTESTEED